MTTKFTSSSPATTALPPPSDADGAWTHYSRLMRRTVADPSLLLNQAYCVELASAWTAFRDRMSAVQ